MGRKITIKTACVQHAEVTSGSFIDKNLGSGYTSKSTCPSGYNPIGIRLLQSTSTYDAVKNWCLASLGIVPFMCLLGKEKEKSVESSRHVAEAMRLLRMQGGMCWNGEVQSSRDVSLSNDTGPCDVFRKPSEPARQKFNRVRHKICSKLPSDTPEYLLPLPLR